MIETRDFPLPCPYFRAVTIAATALTMEDIATIQSVTCGCFFCLLHKHINIQTSTISRYFSESHLYFDIIKGFKERGRENKKVRQRPTFPRLAVSSARKSLTSVFGMGTGGSSLLWSPDKLKSSSKGELSHSLPDGKGQEEIWSSLTID